MHVLFDALFKATPLTCLNEIANDEQECDEHSRRFAQGVGRRDIEDPAGLRGYLRPRRADRGAQNGQGNFSQFDCRCLRGRHGCFCLMFWSKPLSLAK